MSSWKPVPKMVATALGGAVATIVIWILSTSTDVEMPPEVAAALAWILAFVAGYLKTPGESVEGDRGDADTLLLVLALGVGLSIAGVITDTAVLLYAGLAGIAVGLVFLLLRR